jgi:hypothetical protein
MGLHALPPVYGVMILQMAFMERLPLSKHSFLSLNFVIAALRIAGE